MNIFDKKRQEINDFYNAEIKKINKIVIIKCSIMIAIILTGIMFVFIKFEKNDGIYFLIGLCCLGIASAIGADFAPKQSRQKNSLTKWYNKQMDRIDFLELQDEIEEAKKINDFTIETKNSAKLPRK